MPRPRFQKLPEEKRVRILETSAKEFAAHGYDGASLNHILSEAGISKGAAYYYFDDKADLFATVLQHYWQHVLGHVELRIEELDEEAFWDRMAELYRQGLEHAYEQPWILPLFKSMWKTSELPDLPMPLRTALHSIREWIRALVVRGQAIGAVRSDVPLDLVLVLLTAVDDACDHWIIEHWDRMDRAEIESLSATMFAMARRMLEPPRAGER